MVKGLMLLKECSIHIKSVELTIRIKKTERQGFCYSEFRAYALIRQYLMKNSHLHCYIKGKRRGSAILVTK